MLLILKRNLSQKAEYKDVYVEPDYDPETRRSRNVLWGRAAKFAEDLGQGWRPHYVEVLKIEVTGPTKGGRRYVFTPSAGPDLTPSHPKSPAA